MQRYHFHFVQDGTKLADSEGAEFVDVSTARAEAVRQIRAMIAADIVDTGSLWLARRIDVARPDGSIACRVAFAEAIKLEEKPHTVP